MYRQTNGQIQINPIIILSKQFELSKILLDIIEKQYKTNSSNNPNYYIVQDIINLFKEQLSKFKNINTLSNIILDNDKILSTQDENYLYDKFTEFDFPSFIKAFVRIFIQNAEYEIQEKEILLKVDSIRALNEWCDLIIK